MKKDAQRERLSENTMRQKVIHWLSSRLVPGQQFVVQERVSGLLGCLICDGESVILRVEAPPAADLPRMRASLLTRYRDAVFRLHSQVVRIYGGSPKITIHGKIIGGAYPKGRASVLYVARSLSQTVYYSPHFEFYAFDVSVDNGLSDSYLQLVTCNHLLEREHFLYARTLFRGLLMDCLNFPTDFPTNIPSWLSLPSIPGNSCLGTVVRPVATIFGPEGKRILIHNPNPRFTEKPPSGASVEDESKERKWSPICEELLSLIDSFITPDRLFDVLARIPSLSFPRDRSIAIAHLCHSALEEFFEQCSTRYDTLSAKEKHIITREFNQRSAQMLFMIMKV